MPLDTLVTFITFIALKALVTLIAFGSLVTLIALIAFRTLVTLVTFGPLGTIRNFPATSQLTGRRIGANKLLLFTSSRQP